MSALGRSPVWLWIAVAAIWVEEVVHLVESPVGVLSASSVVVTVALAWLLLRGSRVVWVILLLGSMNQVVEVFFFDKAVWVFAAASVVLVCLMAPSSRRFVWRKQPWTPRGRVGSAALRAYTWFEARARYLSAKVTGDEDLPLVNGKLIWRLLVVVILLRPLNGYLCRQRQEGSGGLLVDVLSPVISISAGILELTLLVLLVVAACRYVKSKWPRGGEGPPTAERTAEH